MSDGDEHRDAVKPSEQHGGTPPGEDELRDKGPWAAKAGDGIVPAEQGGTDASSEMLEDEDPELGSEVTGRTTGSEEPATGEGVDPSGGDHADATEDGGPAGFGDVDTDIRAGGAGPRQVDIESGS